MLAEGVFAHTYKEIDKFKVCMFGYVHIWGKYVATGWLCVRGGAVTSNMPRGKAI